MENAISNRVRKIVPRVTSLSQINLIHALFLLNQSLSSPMCLKSSKRSILLKYFWPNIFCIFLPSVPYTSLSSQYSIYYVTVVIVVKFCVQSFETKCRYCTPSRTVSCQSSEARLYSQAVFVDMKPSDIQKYCLLTYMRFSLNRFLRLSTKASTLWKFSSRTKSCTPTRSLAWRSRSMAPVAVPALRTKVIC